MYCNGRRDQAGLQTAICECSHVGNRVQGRCYQRESPRNKTKCLIATGIVERAVYKGLEESKCERGQALIREFRYIQLMNKLITRT